MSIIIVSTDAAAQEYEDYTPDEAVQEFARDEGWRAQIQTVDEFMAELSRLGGYGYVEVDGVRIAEINP